MKLIQKLILMLALLLAGAPAALAADRMLTGNVRDAQDEPLIGVSVQVVENKAAVSTDIDGNFTIKVPAGAVTLKISYVGYKAKDVKVGADQTKVNVILEEDAMMLEETVVIGYGVQKKVNLTGSVASVDAAKLEDRLSHSVTNMLQGSVPGLNITTNSGVPGQQSGALNIRGVTSINETDAPPLVLIDGTVGEINDINPNDVESISVIKDASAAAVYGARGAFGVILVTTKSGKSDNGKAKVRFSGRWGWNEPTTSTDFETRGYWSVYTVNQFVTANGTAPEVPYTDYDMMQLLARVNDKTENPDRPWTMEVERDGKRQWVYYGNYDRYHLVFNDKRPVQQYNLSINGGNDAAKYYLSGGYDYEKGMLKVNPDIYKKYNLRAKIDFRINKWITMQNNTSFMGSTYNYVGPDKNVENSLAYGARHALACFPEKNPDGSWLYLNSYNKRGIMNGRHIVLAEGRHRNVKRRTDFSNMTRIDIKPIKQLTVTADFTYRFSQFRNTYRSNSFDYRVTPDGPMESYTTGAGLNELTEEVNTRNYYTVNAFATYNDTFANDHNVTVMAGYNYESFDYKNIMAYAQNLTSDDLDDLNLKGAGERRVDGGHKDYAIQGIFGRINYDYKGKYLVEVSGRIDGTSRFAKGHRWGSYPSGSVGWRISEENFFQSLRKTVDNLKIRFSYGRLGNQNIKEYYTYLRQVEAYTFAGYTFDGSISGDYTSLSTPLASDRTWEKAEHFDIGLDASLFNTRLNITADAYIRNTIDMLGPGVSLPSVYGEKEPLMNTADLRTKGYEVTVNWMDNIQLGNQMLTYNVGFNLSNYRTEITKYDNPDKSFAKPYYEGMEYGEIWGFKTGGLFKTTEEAQKYASEVNLAYVAKRINGGWQAGDIKYLDVDGSGDISLGKNTADESGDRVKLGNKLPRLQYGFNVGVRYFGFDVSAFFQGTGNHYWYPHGHSMPFWGSYSYPYLSFMPADFREKIWSEDNPNAYFPRPMAYASTSGTLQFVNDRYLQNLRYLRFKNLTVGYTLPKKWTKVAYMEKVRVYFSGENLCYWSPLKKNTKYIDPEAAFDRNGGDGVMSNAFYPWSKTFMFGIDVTF